MRRLIIAVICLIIYGSLFPFSGWAHPAEPLFRFLDHWPATIERADIVQNILAYIPLGLFIALQASRSRSRLDILWRAAITGFILSLAMESIQQFLPARVASLSDLAFNITGSVIGAFAGLQLSEAIKEQSVLHKLHLKWLRPTQFTTLGLMCLLVWVLSQTSPWVPTFDVSQLRRGGAALYHALREPQSIVVTQAASYFFSFVALGLVWATIALRRQHALLIFAGFFAAVLLSKMMIAGRQLSLEAVVGFAAALVFLPMCFSLYGKRTLSWVGALCVALVILLVELPAGPDLDTHAFNWIPLTGQLHSLNGFQSLLELFWLGFALAYFSRINTPRAQRMGMAVLGALLLSAALFALEWHQQDVPGRFADITTVLLGLAGWIAGWFGMLKQPVAGVPVRSRRRRRTGVDRQAAKVMEHQQL